MLLRQYLFVAAVLMALTSAVVDMNAEEAAYTKLQQLAETVRSLLESGETDSAI